MIATKATFEYVFDQKHLNTMSFGADIK